MMNAIKVKPQFQDRRRGEDRRSFESQGIVPIININGKIIHRDRRCTPDRRIANIQVEEIDADIDDIFFYGENIKFSAS